MVFEKMSGIADVKITAYALEKIHLYANIVSALAETPVEIMGYLVGNDCVAQDAVIVPDQIIYCAKSRALAWAKKNSANIVGMWHSHGGFETFHSDNDDIALKNLVVESNLMGVYCEQKDGIKCGYASSVVVNSKSSDVYCAVALKNETVALYYDVNLSVVKSEDVTEYDFGNVLEDIFGYGVVGLDDGLYSGAGLMLDVIRKVKFSGREKVSSIDDVLEREFEFGGLWGDFFEFR